MQTFMERKRIERLEKIGYFNTINHSEKSDPVSDLTNQLLRRTPAILATESPSMFNDEEIMNAKNKRLYASTDISGEL